MDENNKGCPQSVAGDSARPCQTSCGGLAQCSDSGVPVITCGKEHGHRVENSPQSPAGQRHRPGNGQANVAVVRPPGSRHRGQDGQPGETGRLAPVGRESGVQQEPLYPEKRQVQMNSMKLHGPVSTSNVLRLLEYQNYRCALTGRVLTPKTAALDHIVPVRYGGEHVIENAQVLHKDVNRAKGSLTNEEFIGLCREVMNWMDSRE